MQTGDGACGAEPCPAFAAPHPVLGVIPLSLAPCLADLPVPGACQPGAAELFAGHSAWCVLPWERDWIPSTVGQTGLGIRLPGSSRLSHTTTSSLAVRNYVDEHIGIDYSLLRDPSVSTDTLDLDFKVNTGSCLAGPFPSQWERLCQQARWAPWSRWGGLPCACGNLSWSWSRACSSPG